MTARYTSVTTIFEVVQHTLTATALPITRRPSVAMALVTALLATTLLMLAGCGEATGGISRLFINDETSGPAFEIPELAQSSFNTEDVVSQNGASIDLSSLTQGYVASSGTSENRLKFQVNHGEMSYNYDLPSDGTPIVCPLNMGNGFYTFRVMQNTSGNNYVEIAYAEADVVMASEFEPFLRPNVFCDYNENSDCVALARELAEGAANEGDVVRVVYEWITKNITYDSAKATQLANATGYIPNPDSTLHDRSGICFDYVTLGAAMLRSLGIPCKIVTGYVSPDGIYHAWNMVYLDGSWVNAHVTIEANTWTRVDLTFATAGSDTNYVGDGIDYTDRYTY